MWGARYATVVQLRGAWHPTEEAEQEREMSDGDLRPDPCPKCGNPSMLFTPNAQRVPYAIPRRYEAAWQCTTCGHLSFLASATVAMPAART